MKPTTVRSTPGFRPAALTISWSIPGATKPVQEATTRCVIRAASPPKSSASTACMASVGAVASY